ncbi:Hypothetical protein ORPV_874 [Orpheovirus IHUMI-LCC2]|uniref:Uncharacterized protein n=1 Tax=Orpheovirus IHUMI-LCC2 TaxID=2023057 RepID=A0A2I2L5F4_9VIRU|nr:Hypothetical protein ORPV_874 [Orpheovirus IHUMI-LCC2]SNW62778.1 Hypothetical protein ORPV_874 [Orpheovirus IHUMI-LCC2]
MEKFNYDYPEQEGIIPFDLPAEEFLRKVNDGRIKLIPVYEQSQRLVEIWIDVDENIYDIITEILNYILPIDGDIITGYYDGPHGKYTNYINNLPQMQRDYILSHTIHFLDNQHRTLITSDNHYILDKNGIINTLSRINISWTCCKTST